MPPSHPTVDLAAAVLLGLSLPVALIVGWFVYLRLRRQAVPVSRVPDLPLGMGEAAFFFLALALVIGLAGPLVHPAAVVLLFGILLWRKTDLQALWNFEKKDIGQAPLTGIILYLAGLPLVGLLLLVSLVIGQHFGLQMETQIPVQMFLEAKSPSLIIGILLLACVVAPLAEEFFFRGFLYPWVKTHLGRFPAMLLTATLFSLAHMHWSSFLSLAFFGLVLNLVYDFTGKLSYPIALHATFNCTTCAVLLLYKFSAQPA
jgi:uncharacterized protein